MKLVERLLGRISGVEARFCEHCGEVCDMACRADTALRQLRDKQALHGTRFR